MDFERQGGQTEEVEEVFWAENTRLFYNYKHNWCEGKGRLKRRKGPDLIPKKSQNKGKAKEYHTKKKIIKIFGKKCVCLWCKGWGEIKDMNPALQKILANSTENTMTFQGLLFRAKHFRVISTNDSVQFLIFFNTRSSQSLFVLDTQAIGALLCPASTSYCVMSLIPICSAWSSHLIICFGLGKNIVPFAENIWAYHFPFLSEELILSLLQTHHFLTVFGISKPKISC